MHCLYGTKTSFRYSISIVFLSILSGCIIHIGGGSNDFEGNSVSSMFGGLFVSKGKNVTNVSSVNGSIDLHDEVSAHSVDTVNGSIVMGNHVTVESVNTVNGDIESGHHFVSNGHVETVNGEIHIQHSSVINGDLATVNGEIELTNVNVKKSVRTHNGDITLLQNTKVNGDIIFQRNQNRDSKAHIPTLKIDSSSLVIGNIILYRDVKLDIADAQLLKRIEYRISQEK